MAKKWDIKFDPTDHTWAVAKFDTVLGVGEKIASIISIEPDSAGADYKLVIDEVGATEPELVLGDTAIKVWLSIEEAERENAKFANGILLGVVITILTDAVPPNRYQRTWQANFVQQ